MSSTPTQPVSALDAAASLEAEGRFEEAIALLSEANRSERSAELDQRLVALRHRAGSA